MTAPHKLTAAAAARKILAKELSAEELARDCAARIEKLEPHIHAWVDFQAGRFTAEAREADRRRAEGAAQGALFGVPVGVKDIFNTADMPTAMGSPIWKGFTPGNDARAVFNLKRAGCVVAGKTVTAEFAVHAPGPTINPVDPSRIPGTSSSGSAAAVAAEMVPVAIGTQTAGSVVRPASYCGVYGFKPSFGLIPRTGMLKTTDSLDTVGFFSRSVEDLALVFDAIRVHGQDYPIAHAKLALPENREKKGKKWKIAFVRHPKWALAEPAAKEAIAAFAESLGREADVEVSAPELPSIFSEAHETHAAIYDKSLAYYFKNEFKERTLISREIKEMIEHGNTVTTESFQAARDRQVEITTEADKFLSGYDAVFTLSTAGEAPRVGEPEKDDSCLIWTLCGIPAMNLPMLVGPSGLPIGVQVVARRYADYRLLSFAERLSAAAKLSRKQTTEILH